MAEEKLNNKEKLHIVVKLPVSLKERIHSFPTLHLIRDAYEEHDYHIICDEREIEILNALPLKAYYHELKESELNNVLEAHRIAVHLKIPKVDYYYDFDGTMYSAFLGYFLGAKKRVGFSDAWWGSWLYTTSVKKGIGHHPTDRFNLLFKESTHLKIPEDYKIKGKEYSEFYPVETPSFIVIDIYPFEVGKIDPWISELINLHEDKMFVLMSSQEVEKGGLLIESLIPRLGTKNRFKHFVHTSWIDLAKVLGQSRGFIGRNTDVALFACYLGCPSLIIYEDGDPRLDAPFYFYSNWRLMELSDPQLRKDKEEGILKKRLQADPFSLLERYSEVIRF